MAENVQNCFKRYEKKYMLTSEQYRQFRERMQEKMEPDHYGSYSIGNLYYDTENYQLIRTSLEKPVYKEKLRMRSYGVPGDRDRVFVELKKKYDGVVYKRRVALEAAEAAAYINDGQRPGEETQICREIDWFMRSYRPRARVYIAYDREAWAGRDMPDLRVTFDTNLRWRTENLDLRAGDYGVPILPSGQILMEVKIPGAAPIWLAELFSDLGIVPTSFSKYGTWYKRTVLGGTPGPVTLPRPILLPDRPAALRPRVLGQPALAG